MFGLGGGELLLLGIIALVFIGPKKLPELARGLGKGIREFQKAKNEILDSTSEEEERKINSSSSSLSESDSQQQSSPPSRSLTKIKNNLARKILSMIITTNQKLLKDSALKFFF